jgi:hypothetical protein
MLYADKESPMSAVKLMGPKEGEMIKVDFL